MENWKKALVAGTLGAGAVLLLTGKRALGLALAGVGGAVLAAEYPEKLEQLRENLPEYTDRTIRILDNVSRAGAKIAEVLERRGQAALDEIRAY
jgi:DNA mismatch repair protein MutH